MTDCEEVLIHPRREKGDPELRGPGLLLINPAEARQAAAFAETASWRRHFLFHSALYVSPAGSWLAGPAVGAPMAVLCLEKLIALGAETTLVMGWGGALSPERAIGDLLLPTWAVSEEGTSAHYPVASSPEASPRLRLQLETVLRAAGFRVAAGPVWTTDAPYRETRAKVAAYRQQGLQAVEMEFAALATVAAFRGVELAAVLALSDSLAGEAWESGFHRPAFKKNSRQALEVLLRHLGQFGKEAGTP